MEKIKKIKFDPNLDFQWQAIHFLRLDILVQLRTGNRFIKLSWVERPQTFFEGF